MKHSELKPCPFCGHQTHWIEDIYEDEERRLYVFCNSCGAMGAWKCTVKEAITAWNTRAERTCKNLSSSSLFTCSECNGHVTQWRVAPSYCPECGGAFRKEDATEHICTMSYDWEDEDWCCSECDCFTPGVVKPLYCSRCGARVVSE